MYPRDIFIGDLEDILGGLVYLLKKFGITLKIRKIYIFKIFNWDFSKAYKHISNILKLFLEILIGNYKVI